MTTPEKQQFMQQLALWSRLHGKKRPTNKDGWKILLAEFLASQSQPETEDEPPAWNEVPDQDETHLIDDGATVQIADVHKEGVFEDDWDRLLRDRAAASIGPNGELLDDFDTEFQMMGKTHAELSQIAPFARNNPPSVLNGNIGTSALCQPGADPVTVAQWIGDNAETLPVTVTLGPIGKFKQNVVNSSTVQSLSGYRRSFAYISYGSRGAQIDLEVDIGPGTQFVIGASFVTIQVGLDSGSTLPTQLAGMLSFHPVIRQQPVTRTVYIDGLFGNANNISTFLIPTFAKSLMVMSFSAPFTIDIYDFNGVGIASATVAAGAVMTPLRIPADAYSCRLTNTSGAASGVSFRALFDLSL